MSIATYQAWVPWILGIILIGGSVLLAAKSNLLRDSSTSNSPPFSFSRVQLLWWVLIVAYCLLHYYAKTAELPMLNETCLVLLGIGVGTFGIANVLDSRQRTNATAHGTELSQDSASKDFLTDILSDDKGVSVHRLQALIFNAIYGVAFVTYFVANDKFADYGNMQYAVLGLSSAGYLGLKSLENDPTTKMATGAGGDELPDVDTGVAQAPLASG